MPLKRLRIFSTPVRDHFFRLEFFNRYDWTWEQCDEEHEKERIRRYEEIDCNTSLSIHDKKQIPRPVYLAVDVIFYKGDRHPVYLRRHPAFLVFEVDRVRLYEITIEFYGIHVDVNVSFHWNLKRCQENTKSEVSWREENARDGEVPSVGLYIPAGYSYLSVYVECFDQEEKREHVENSSDCCSICSDTY